MEDTIKAKSFQLVDDNGKSRAAFKMNEHGDPSLVMIDKAGAARLTMTIMQDQTPVIMLKDNSENVRMAFSLSIDGRPVIAFIDSDQRIRLQMLIESSADMPVVVLTKDGDIDGAHMRILLSPEGNPEIKAFDSSGTEIWRAS